MARKFKDKPQPRPTLEKLFEQAPPHSPEAEMALLGACILDRRAIDACFQLLPADAFFSESHAIIWAALVATREAPDLLALHQHLKDNGQLKDICGGEYLQQLAHETPGPTTAAHYAKIIADKAKLRRIISAAGDILHAAYTGADKGSAKVADAALASIMDACRDSGTGRDVTLVDAIDMVIADIGKGSPGMWRTNLHDFDEQFGGILKPGVTTFFGPSGSGKTTFCLQLAVQLSMTRVKTRVFSREQGAKRIAATVMQQLCEEYPVGVHEYLKTGGKPTATEWNAIRQARKDAADFMDFAVVSDRLDAQQIYQKCAMYKQHGVELVMIDYIQNLPPIDGVDRGTQQIEESCQCIQSIAVDHGISVFLVSQVTADASRNANEKCPKLSDCRGGGAIENISDVAYAVWRPNMHMRPQSSHQADRDFAASERCKTSIQCAKAKYTTRGEVALRFDPRVMRFVDIGGQMALPSTPARLVQETTVEIPFPPEPDDDETIPC